MHVICASRATASKRRFRLSARRFSSGGGRHTTPVGRGVVAFLVALAPATFFVTSAGADTLTGAYGYVAFAPPASGANGSYSDSIRYPNAYTVPSVSDGVSGDTFNFSASGSSGCSIGAKGTGFTYANAGVCSITATSSRADDDQAPGAGPDGDADDTVFTGTLVLTILKATQSISLGSQSVSIATSIQLKASGYLGSGTINYAVVGGTASGCSINASNRLISSSAGTCLVTATISADSIYLAATSSPATITFTVPATPPPPTTTTSTTTTSTTTTTTTTTIPVPPPVHIISSPPQVAPPTSMVIGPFAEGSFALNAKLKKQVEAMALLIKAKKYKTVDLAGYTDNVFSPAFNLALIQSRAAAVASELASDLATLSDANVTVTIVSGGPVIVLASNSTAKGRAANRRVVATLKAS